MRAINSVTALAVVLLFAISLAGCAMSKRPEHYAGSHGHNSSGVVLVRDYVPVEHTRPREWGRYAFVPGFARQGVAVTPSRTWNYGQGRGWGDAHRAEQRYTIKEMTGVTNPNDRRPCRDRLRAPSALSRPQKYWQGVKFAGFKDDSTVRQQPLTVFEKHRLRAYERAGCTSREARATVLNERVEATNYARPIAAKKPTPPNSKYPQGQTCPGSTPPTIQPRCR